MTTMDDQTVWFTKQKNVCAELQDPALHRRIKKCLEERKREGIEQPPKINPAHACHAERSNEVDYGLMMLHILCPHSFNNELKGYDGSRCIPFETHFSIGSLNFSSRTNRCHGWSGAGLMVVGIGKNYEQPSRRVYHIIQAINEMTGADIGGRKIEGLDNRTFQKLYHIFMHLPEFEE